MRHFVTSTIFALCMGPTSLYAQLADTSTSAAVSAAHVGTSSTVVATAEVAPPVAPAHMAAAVATPAISSPSSLLYGPYLRLSGLAVRDSSFGLTAPFGALVRMEGGVELAPAELSGLAFELGMGIGAQGATSFDAVQSRFALTSFQASALYRRSLASYFTGYGRATAGFNIAYLDLAPAIFEQGVDEFALGASVAGTLGIELSIPIRFTPQKDDPQAGENYLGFFFEAGYEVHTNLHFDGASRAVDADPEPARIAGSREGLGDLNLTGWIWRLGGSFRF